MYKIITATSLGLLAFSSYALADEFGARFAETTPPGLAEHAVAETPDIAMDDIAKDLQDIMPAAGDSEATEQEKPEE